MTRASERFPTDSALTRAVDAALERHVSEVRDYTHRFHERWKRWGVETLRDSGWALRPLFAPAAHLEFVAAAVHARLVALRARLRAMSPKELARVLPLPPGTPRALDLRAGFDSHDWLAHLRPDGFLFGDRFVLSELNFGNGIAVSCGYTELVADYWRAHPVLARLGLDVARLHRRPLPRYLGVMRRAMRPSARPFVALLTHHREWEVIRSYPKRVEDQFEYVQRELYRLGVESRIVTEQELVVGRDGNPRIVGDRRRPDLVMLVTVGSAFLDEPALLSPGGPLQHLRGERIGDVAIVKPLAAIAMDKGVLPLLQTVPGPRKAADGFRFEIAPTEFPRGRPPSRYRRSAWVLKRAFDGKDTHVGASCSADRWAKATAVATGGDGYVAQRYVSLPKARLPFFVDGKHLEFVESRVELSSFFFDGAFGGAAARHAPDAEGLVMSDIPERYGFSTIFAV